MDIPGRYAAQLLHRPVGLSAGDVVGHLLAVQAQDVPSAHLAFRARSATLTVGEVEAAWEAREIVRTWGPRGTLHFIRTEDLPWLVPLTVRRTGSLRRLAEEGVTAADPLALIEGALAGQGPLTKAELEERLSGQAKGQGVVHLIGLAASYGRAVLGPSRGTKPTYVYAADWLGAPIAFEQDRGRALAELGVRYRRAHADAGPEDLAAWSGVSLGDARTAWPAAAPARQDPGNMDVRLAPAFEEYLLGWKSRDAILAPEHARKVFPGGGILRPIVLVDGVIAGTWSRKGTVEAFGEVPDVSTELLDIDRFFGGGKTRW